LSVRVDDLLVDTSVWSLGFRRDVLVSGPEVSTLRAAIDGGDAIVTTGLVLQELLQGFAGPRARNDIVQRFAALPLLVPDRRDYIDAADIRNVCRRAGVQIGTIDALLGQLCIRHELTLLTTDADFTLAARHCPLQVWSPAARREHKKAAKAVDRARPVSGRPSPRNFSAISEYTS
jgi:predicted nucleic acid-binding protein